MSMMGHSNDAGCVLPLDAADEEVAREERRSQLDELRIDEPDDPADPAPREPRGIEPLAPEPRVPATLDHLDAVPRAVPAELVHRQMADVVRVRRTVRDVRPAAEEQPETIAPVPAVRLHPDEG